MHWKMFITMTMRVTAEKADIFRQLLNFSFCFGQFKCSAKYTYTRNQQTCHRPVVATETVTSIQK